MPFWLSPNMPTVLKSQAATSPRANRLFAGRCGEKSKRTASQHGFTLLELLVVLAILGLLIGLVAPRVMTVLGSSKEKVVRIDIERLATNLDMYKLDVGSYPTTEQGLQALIAQPPGVAHWSGPYLKGDKLPQDPWGHPFAYRSPSQRPGHEFDLYSLGPSGDAGSAGSAIYNE